MKIPRDKKEVMNVCIILLVVTNLVTVSVFSEFISWSGWIEELKWLLMASESPVGPCLN